MATNYNVNTVLQVTNKFTQPLNQFRQQMSGIRDNVDNATSGVKNFNSNLNNSSSIDGMVSKVKGLTTAFLGVAGIKSIVKSALDFDDAFAKTKTIMDETAVGYGDMKKGIMDLSNQTGISANQIADDVYNAISAGQKTEDALGFIQTSSKLAKAGFAESADALDILTTTLNSYGLASDQASAVSDKLIMTQNLGKTTVAELSSSMGKAIPTANAFGVNLDQLCTGYALMTSKGIATAESTTYMSSMMNELGKSGTQASSALKSATGQTFQELMASGKSLGDVMASMNEYATKNGKSLADMFGSAEAGKAAMLLATDSGQAFNNVLEQMADSTGSTDTAFEKLQTAGSKIRKSMNEMKNVIIKLGSAFTPVIDLVANGFTQLSNYVSNINFNGIEESLKWLINTITQNKDKIISTLKAIMPVVAGVIAGFLAFKTINTITSTINNVKKSITGVKAGFAMLTSPIGLTVIAIGLFVGACIYAYQHSQKFRDIVNNAWESVKNKVSNVVEKIGSLIQSLKNWLSEHQEFVQGVKNTISAIIESAINYLGECIENAKTIFGGIVDFIGGIITIVQGIIDGNWTQVWEGCKEVVKGAIEIITGLWNGLVDLLSHPIDTVVNITKSVFGGKDDTGSETTEVGHNAKGTNNWRGGLTWVNEDGGELMNLPNGTQIIPHDLSKEIINNTNNSSPSFTIAKLADSIIVREEADIDRIGQSLFRQLKIRGMAMA